MFGYDFEKNINKKLQQEFPKDILEKICANLEKHDDQEQKLYYETGICSLLEFSEQRNYQQIFWFQKQNEIRYIILHLVKIVFNLFLHGIIQGDIKPRNIILYENYFLPFLEIKLIDFGSAVDDYQLINGLTPLYTSKKYQEKFQESL